MLPRNLRPLWCVLWWAACGTSGPQAAASAGAGAGDQGELAGRAAADGGTGCSADLSCQLAAPASSGDPHLDCVNRINQFRVQCACLPPLERWTAAESCADQMAAHDSTTGSAHSGFTGHICTPGGNGQNECPGYRSEASVMSTCLQQMWSEGPATQSPCDGSCFQQHGHFLNMTNASFKRVACGFATTSDGTLWAVQNYSP